MKNDKRLVFLDGASRPYLCMKWGNEDKLWLFYWHPENHWTSLREIRPHERFPDNLTQPEQDMYHRQHEKWEQELTPHPKQED